MERKELSQGEYCYLCVNDGSYYGEGRTWLLGLLGGESGGEEANKAPKEAGELAT